MSTNISESMYEHFRATKLCFLILKKCVIELHFIANLLLSHAWNFTTQIEKKKELNVKSL